VTINGVRISRDKHDIPIPQGIAHAVERVMFPLPVGDIIQTLRSDREHRFTKFLRAIQTSGLADTLTGNLPYHGVVDVVQSAEWTPVFRRSSLPP
jgi:hypothetical protein